MFSSTILESFKEEKRWGIKFLKVIVILVQTTLYVIVSKSLYFDILVSDGKVP